MDLQLKDKRVIVTGATQGIGRAIAQTFAEEGARLVITARSEDTLQETAEALAATGAGAIPVRCDVTDDDSVTTMVEQALGALGGIDILVNNAAGRVPAGDFLKIDNDQWLTGWNQKIQCHVRVSRAVFPHLQAGGGGKIVNILGTAARNPKASYMPVGMSNAALVNFTKSLADYGAPHGILVVGVAPSATVTDRWQRLLAQRAEAEGKTPAQLQAEVDATLPLGRMAQPREIADVAVFAASPRASYLSGSVITVDGNSTTGVYN